MGVFSFLLRERGFLYIFGVRYLFAGVRDFRKKVLDCSSFQENESGFQRALCSLCTGFVRIWIQLTSTFLMSLNRYYPQYAAPYAETIRRIWHIFQGLSRNLSGGFVRPLQGLKNLSFILFIALSRSSRRFPHFPHFLSLSLKMFEQPVKPLGVPLTVSLTSFSVPLTEYAVPFGRIYRSFNRK